MPAESSVLSAPAPADDHRRQSPLIGHAHDRHPAYAKKPRCLFWVQQRLVNGGIGRWRRQGSASG